MKVIFRILFIIAFIFLGIPRVYAQIQITEISKSELVGPIGIYNSQYSPYIMHQPGWGSWLMYYCKSVPINDFWRDKVYRRESWTDGLSGWTTPQSNDMIVVEGTDSTAKDDLSCSPGVLIDNNGIWHMYYVTANRNSFMTLFLMHATASSPGVNWTKLGEIETPSIPGYYETPSPIFLNNKYILYIAGGGGLYRSESTDGHRFGEFVNLPNTRSVQAGRVTYTNGIYYYVYSYNPGNVNDAPYVMYLSTSTDGINFSGEVKLAQSNGSGWDGSLMWSPHAYIQNNEMRVYYAGNTGGPYPTFWGFNSSIGVRRYQLSFPTPIPTQAPIQPNCSNVTGPTNLIMGGSGTYSASVYSPGSALSGEINYFNGTVNRITYQDITPPNAVISTSWTPPAIGTYSVCCRAWNDGVAECRPAGFGGIGGLVYACTGPNSCLNVTVIAPTVAPTTIPTLVLTSIPSVIPTSIPTQTPMRGDTNGDGRVDDLDYTIWANNYGITNATGPRQGDFNGDRRVDDLDYTIWANNYGR